MAGCNCNSWFFLYSLSLYKFFEEKAFLLEVYDSSKREWANNGSCDTDLTWITGLGRYGDKRFAEWLLAGSNKAKDRGG